MMDGAVQPSSVDLRIDRYFRVFRNDTTPFIDPKQPQEDLTELVEVQDDNAFILHPGEFVLGSTLGAGGAWPTTSWAGSRGRHWPSTPRCRRPFGWTTMGALAPGDIVFDEAGQPTRVVAASPDLPAPALSRGRVLRRFQRRGGRRATSGRRSTRPAARPAIGDREVRSTERIAQSLRVRGETEPPGGAHASGRVPRTGAPDPSVRPRRVAWRRHELEGRDHDRRPVRRRGDPSLRVSAWSPSSTEGPYLYLAGGAGHTRDEATGRFTSNDSLWSTLRAMGLLEQQARARRLPAVFGRAADRVAPRPDGQRRVRRQVGRCDFTSVHFPLAEQVMELVASLGLRPTLAKKRAMLYGDRLRTQVRGPVHTRSTGLPAASQARAAEGERTVPSIPCDHRRAGGPAGSGALHRGGCPRAACSSVTRSYIPTHNSSLGRLGLLIHSTAGFVDAGWDGHLTLELSQRGQPADRAVPGDEDRADLVPADDDRGRRTRTAATSPARSTRASTARPRAATTSTSRDPYLCVSRARGPLERTNSSEAGFEARAGGRRRRARRARSPRRGSRRCPGPGRLRCPRPSRRLRASRSRTGTRPRHVCAPVAIASWARSTLTFLPACSSIHMRPPPAPQHMPFVPLRGISTMSMPVSDPMTSRGEVDVVEATEVAGVVVGDALVDEAGERRACRSPGARRAAASGASPRSCRRTAGTRS